MDRKKKLPASNRKLALKTRREKGFNSAFPTWDLAFPSSDGKESACNTGDLGSISGLARSPGEGKGYPLEYSGLENSRDFIVHGVTKSQARLSDFHFHFISW